MNYFDFVAVLKIAVCLVYCTWGFLFVALCLNIFYKNYDQLKLILLYCLNTVVFLFAWFFAVSLGIIVAAPIGDTREESLDLLKTRTFDHFLDFSAVTLAFVAAFGLINYLYLRFIAKNTNKKLALKLAIAELGILMAAAVFGCSMHIESLSGDIENHFAYLEKNAGMNNIVMQADSTLRLVNSRQPAGEMTPKIVGHLLDTTWISGNVIIFLRPDSIRFSEMEHLEIPGLYEVDSDFGYGIRATDGDMENDSVKYQNIITQVVTTRFVVLTECSDCPLVIDRDTVNYGIILTGVGRKHKTAYSTIHSWSYYREIKDYFDLW